MLTLTADVVLGPMHLSATAAARRGQPWQASHLQGTAASCKCGSWFGDVYHCNSFAMMCCSPYHLQLALDPLNAHRVSR